MHISKLLENFVFSAKRISTEVCDFLKFIKENKLTAMLCWFFLLFSYGIKWIFYNISADTEIMINDYRSMTSSWIGIDRFGLVLTKKIFGLVPFNPFIANFLMLCTLFFLLMFLSYIFNFVTQKFNIKAKCLFILPCVFITHPVFAEQFNYTLQAFEVSFAIFLAFLVAYLITRWIFDSSNLVHLLIGVTFLVWSFWSYQAILFLYISLVLALLVYTFFNSFKSKDESITEVYNKNFFRSAAFKYIATFLSSYAIYFLANKATKIFLHSSSSSYLSNMVTWGHESPFAIIKKIFGAIFSFLGIKIYFLIVIMVLFIAYMCFNAKNKNKILFSSSVLALCVSPAFLSFYLGIPAVPRTQFSMPFVFAFAFFLVAQCLYKNTLVKNLFLIFCLATAFKQGYRVAGMMYYEYMRYNYDVSVADKIDERINLLDIEKQENIAVMFIGILRSPVVPKEMRGHNVGISFFEWRWVGDPTGVTHIALGFMKTIGYNRYRMPNEEESKRAIEIAKTMQVWPSPYSVKYEDGIIIVKLPESFSV